MTPKSPRAGGRAACGRATVAGVVALMGTAAFLAVAALALGGDHPGRIKAVGFAVAVCLPGALGAWLLARQPAANTAGGVAGPLAGIALRIMPPLAALAWISSTPGDLRDAGAAPLLAAFYLALLAADILLHVGTRAPAGCNENAPH